MGKRRLITVWQNRDGKVDEVIILDEIACASIIGAAFGLGKRSN
ncbi:MAG: hypothetical protein ACK5ZE_21320 [Pseudanabaena sp.]|jgi:hypothetical protein